MQTDVDKYNLFIHLKIRKFIKAGEQTALIQKDRWNCTASQWALSWATRRDSWTSISALSTNNLTFNF
jgi:hypothetical protein